MTKAEKLRQLREACGLRKRDVSRKTGISEASLCRYENGERNPSTALLYKLCKFYNVSIEDILKEDDDDFKF